jgi:sugar phosphate isomerase/epimerase
LSGRLTTHLDEVRPGLGGLDYRVYLQELNKLSPDIPLMLEHLPTEEEYALAASHIRAVAKGLMIEAPINNHQSSIKVNWAETMRKT